MVALAIITLLLTPQVSPDSEVVVGSKTFTESVILGEMITLLARETGYRVNHRRELGGTRFVWSALRSGEIDIYPEYTGTIREEILAGQQLADTTTLAEAMADRGIKMSEPLGFNNTYAITMADTTARRLGIESISDLRRHPQLRIGFSNEFMDREDGWPGLRQAYNLPHENVQGLEHDLAYRGLAEGSIDVMDAYSTDAAIAQYDLRILDDDRDYFPDYNAVLLYRVDLTDRAPGVIRAIERLEGRLSEETMIHLNGRARIDGRAEPRVAADFLSDSLGIETTVVETNRIDRVWQRTVEHLYLVGISLLAAILAGIPLGIWAVKRPRVGRVILGFVGVIYTIPSLALLVFMIPLLGIGGPPAILALFLYSLLPIVHNTHAGLSDISPELMDSARAIGLPKLARLRKIELPLASRSILAGIETSAIINIGTATLGALIGAGGYGQPILTGIRLDNIALILEGAVPAALLALLAQGVFELFDRVVVPQGLRLGN
jgi:osmoprotectant transport system permease protein